VKIPRLRTHQIESIDPPSRKQWRREEAHPGVIWLWEAQIHPIEPCFPLSSAKAKAVSAKAWIDRRPNGARSRGRDGIAQVQRLPARHDHLVGELDRTERLARDAGRDADTALDDLAVTDLAAMGLRCRFAEPSIQADACRSEVGVK
jgi:hypothetical protein